jgi:hypothetical protein
VTNPLQLCLNLALILRETSGLKAENAICSPGLQTAAALNSIGAKKKKRTKYRYQDSQRSHFRAAHLRKNRQLLYDTKNAAKEFHFKYAWTRGGKLFGRRDSDKKTIRGMEDFLTKVRQNRARNEADQQATPAETMKNRSM